MHYTISFLKELRLRLKLKIFVTKITVLCVFVGDGRFFTTTDKLQDVVQHIGSFLFTYLLFKDRTNGDNYLANHTCGIKGIHKKNSSNNFSNIISFLLDFSP